MPRCLSVDFANMQALTHTQSRRCPAFLAITRADQEGDREGMAAVKINRVLHDKDERDELFSRIDGNGNGVLSLAEIDGFVKAEYPGQFHHQVLMRAYKAADVSKDGLIDRPEFFKCGAVSRCRCAASEAPVYSSVTPVLHACRLLKYLVYFQEMWGSFEDLDKDKDGRLSFEEFKASCTAMDIGLASAEAAEEFAKCDADGGGMILFEEFTTWCCHRSVGTDPLAKEAEEDLLRDRCAEQIRAYLLRKGKGDHTEGVVKAFKKAQYEPLTWVDELEQLETEGLLDSFLGSCKKKEKREEAKGGGTKGAGKNKSKPKHPPQAQLTMPDKAGRAKLFRDIDVNGNNGLSLAEIDKAVESGLIGRALNYPDFNHKPALMRAYHAADRSGDAFIQRGEFFKLLKYEGHRIACTAATVVCASFVARVFRFHGHPQCDTMYTLNNRYMVYFNNLWHKFEEIDSDHDRRINAEEFAAGCEVVGLRLSPEETAAEFKKCDADGGGQILFAEFCTWCAERHIADHESAEEAEPPEPARARQKRHKQKKGGACCGSRPTAH